MSKNVTFYLVSLKEPCTACKIISGLLKDMIKKLEKRYSNVETYYITLNHPDEASTIEGLEIKRFPALLINSKQITAGTLPGFNELVMLLDSEKN